MGNKQGEPYYCPSFFRAQSRLRDQAEPGRVRKSREPLGARLHGRVAEGRELHRGWKRRRSKDPPHLSPSCQTGYPLHRFPLPFLCLSQLQLPHYSVPHAESPRISWLVLQVQLSCQSTLNGKPQDHPALCPFQLWPSHQGSPSAKWPGPPAYTSYSSRQPVKVIRHTHRLQRGQPYITLFFQV